MIGLTKKFTAMNIPVDLLEQLKALKKAYLAHYGKSVSYEEIIVGLIEGLQFADPKLFSYYKMIIDIENQQTPVMKFTNIEQHGKLTLHKAIVEVLKEAKRPLTTSEIAGVINTNRLYTRADGLPVPSTQVSARISHYPSLFSVNRATSPKTISLK